MELKPCIKLARCVLFGLVVLVAPPLMDRQGVAYADTLREVAERVARQHDAKVISAREVSDRNGQRIYVIRILTREGVVRTIRVPADTMNWRVQSDLYDVGLSMQNTHLLDDAAFQFTGFSHQTPLPPPQQTGTTR